MPKAKVAAALDERGSLGDVGRGVVERQVKDFQPKIKGETELVHRRAACRAKLDSGLGGDHRAW